MTEWRRCTECGREWPATYYGTDKATGERRTFCEACWRRRQRRNYYLRMMDERKSARTMPMDDSAAKNDSFILAYMLPDGGIADERTFDTIDDARRAHVARMRTCDDYGFAEVIDAQDGMPVLVNLNMVESVAILKRGGAR